MLLTRTTRNQTFKGNTSYSTPTKKSTKPKEPNVDEMILARDFSGAVAVLEVCTFLEKLCSNLFIQFGIVLSQRR